MAKMNKAQIKELPQVTLNVQLKDVSMAKVMDMNNPASIQLVQPTDLVSDGKLNSIVKLKGLTPPTEKAPNGTAVYFKVDEHSYHALPSSYFIASDGMWRITGCRVIPKGTEVTFEGETESTTLKEAQIWGDFGKFRSKFDIPQ